MLNSKQLGKKSETKDKKINQEQLINAKGGISSINPGASGKGLFGK
jgi:hypothetical protein